MVGDLFVGNLQDIGFFQAAFLYEKVGQTLVEALPHDLFHQPHDFGEPGGHQLVGVAGYGDGGFHQLPVDLRRDDPDLGVLFCLDGQIKLQTVQHTGGGKQADIHLKETVEGNLPSFVRDNIGPKLSGADQ